MDSASHNRLSVCLSSQLHACIQLLLLPERKGGIVIFSACSLLSFLQFFFFFKLAPRFPLTSNLEIFLRIFCLASSISPDRQTTQTKKGRSYYVDCSSSHLTLQHANTVSSRHYSPGVLFITITFSSFSLSGMTKHALNVYDIFSLQNCWVGF